MAELGREHQRLAGLVARANRLNKLEAELAQVRELVALDDPEMREEVQAEQGRLEAEIPRLEEEIKPLLVPPDPLDDRNAIVEIRAGTGGDEAALFAADLYRMYILRKVLAPLSPVDSMEFLMGKIEKTDTNADFLESMNS